MLSKKQIENHLSYVGKKINRLTILEYLSHKKGKARVIAKCECGEIKEYSLFRIKKEQTKSCGCLNDEIRRSANRKTHELTNHPLYAVWRGMYDRCYNKNNIAYNNYGGIGVTMCQEWKNDFKSFYDWAMNNGWCEWLHIDKDIIPKMLGISSLLYSPEMCCLVTQKENNRNTSRNRKLEYKGVEKCIGEWAEELNINYNTFSNRIKRGWPLDKAFNPIKIRSNQYINKRV